MSLICKRRLNVDFSWRSVLIHTLTPLCLFSAVGISHAATLRVPGQYGTIAEAISASGNGDIIEVASGTYTSGIVATVNRDNLTIRGVGGKAHLNATGVSISNRKAIFVVTGDDITLENLEFSGAKVPDENGAGIRHEGGVLNIKHCYFHDNENGILTSGQGAHGELIIDNSEFNHNGLGHAGYTHNIYVNHIGRFVFRSSYSHHATHGHNIKSRADENHILYSRIMDEVDGNASYQIDLPNGGLTFIIGNSIHQGVNNENPSMISYGREGETNPLQEIYVSGNTFVNDDNHGTSGMSLSGSSRAFVVNNIFDNVHNEVNGTAELYSNNLECNNDCGFVSRNGFDYHLQGNSPAKNYGITPSTYHGVSLLPSHEYVHPLQTKQRVVEDRLDAGAFEYTTTVPSPQNLMVVPSNHILLKKTN